MRTPHCIPLQLASLVLAGSLILGGCGRNQSSPLSEGSESATTPANSNPSEAALGLQTEQKLDPLGKADVDLYLRVMRTASERAKNPPPNDMGTLDAAKKIVNRGMGDRVPSPDEVKVLERANLIAISMDQIVANDMNVDARTYRGIAEAVESALAPPPSVVASESPAVVPSQPQSPVETRLREVNAANAKFLAPYREEIETLVGIVRNPARLPK